MRCERVREIALEADPKTLEQALSGIGELAEHMGRCPACAERVRAVLVLNESLAAGLAGAAPAVPVDRALAMAGSDVARRRAVGRRRNMWRGLIPLAAAATVAGVLAVRSVVLEPGGTPGEMYAGQGVALSAVAPDVDVTAPAGTSVAVFRTPNPEIVVFWFYEGGEGR